MSAIRTQTKCRVCGKVFYGPSALIVSGADNAPLAQYLAELGAHAATHAEAEGFIVQKQLEFAGYMRYGIFETTDSSIARQRDYFRWNLLRELQRPSIAREQIESSARRWIAEWIGDGHMKAESSKDVEAMLIKSLSEMRAILLEDGRYHTVAPGSPAKSVIV